MSDFWNDNTRALDWIASWIVGLGLVPLAICAALIVHRGIMASHQVAPTR